MSLQTGLPLSSMVWHAAMATNLLFSMAAQVLLCGAHEMEDVLILAAGIAVLVLSGRHAANMWVCRCISACCAGWLCPDDGLGKIVAIVCCFERPAFGKKGDGAAEKSASSRPSGSGALQPAALSSSLQKLVDDMRNWVRDNKRWPRRTKGTSEEERAQDKLAKRWSDNKDRVPDDTKRELNSLSGVPQPAASSGAKPAASKNGSTIHQSRSDVPKPAPSSSTVQRPLDDLKRWAAQSKRWPPKRWTNPASEGQPSEEQRAEDKLARRLATHKHAFPENRMQELELLARSGAPQPAEATSNQGRWG